MDAFHPSVYFDLSTFSHASLFEGCDPIWLVLKKIHTYLLSQRLGEIQGKIEPGAFLVQPEEITIGEGTIVESGAYIHGPCIIGKNCQIRNGAYIRGDALIGNQCVVGHATEIKNSLLLDGAQAAHFAYVGDSILGNHVNLGAGTKCANLRFDHQNIQIFSEERKIDSGLKKFGAILGDYVQTGCNSVTNPGTLMGKQSCLAPCATVRGIVPAKSSIKSAENLMQNIR